MKLNEYARKAETFITRSSDNETYLILGICAECGELADKVAKAIRKEEAEIQDNSLFYMGCEDADKKCEDIALEIGDILWFTSQIARKFGFSLEEIAQMNLRKLAGRQQRGTIIGNGDHR